MSDSDKAYVLDSIMRLSIWEIIDIEKSMRGGIVLSIWTEAVQLENKASSKKWNPHKIDLAPMVQPMAQSNFKNDATKPSQTNSSQAKPTQDKSNQNISKDIWLQAIVDLDKSDLRNKWTQRIIDIVKSQVELEGFLYDNNKEERNRATIIAKRQSDWWTFIKEESEEKEEYIIRSIISYSNQNEYTSKIRSAKDFHEKWKRVANTMKEAWKEAEKNIPNPNPLLRFTR